MNIQSLSWSGFLVDDDGLRVAFDPHWTVWRDKHLLPPWDLHPLQSVFASHGHDDHYGDVPHLLRLHPGAVLGGAPELVADAQARPGLGGRGVAVGTEGWTPVGPVQARLLPGLHVGGGAPVEQAGKFGRYLRRRPLWALDLLMHHALDPSLGGVFSILVRFPSGRTVLHAAETLHRRTDLADLRVRLGGDRVDVLLLGVEPGEEAAAVAAARVVDARRVIAFTPHQPTRAWFGLNEERMGVRRDLAVADGARWVDAGDQVEALSA